MIESGFLPASYSSFLGRREEMMQATQLLEASRMVTLTGPPGIGKSRLALQLARRVADEQGDGAWLVELAPVRDGALVPAALAAALSVREVPGERLIDTLIVRLGDRRALLVLDNCEHLLGACADVVDALLRGCPHLRILATSREALSITGEQVWQVPALSTPAIDEAATERLMDYDAVRLFVERAGAVQPAFTLSSQNAGAVAEITRRLDGMPLAIELAAARTQTLTASEIARLLDQRFSLLIRGSRSDLARHQTLQAAIDWSYELLSAPEAALLRRLSVFLGGFPLEAAEAVGAGEAKDGAPVVELLSRLVTKSVVAADTSDGTSRYRLLETIRAYARDRLEEAGEAPAAAAAHVDYCVALAERAEPELTGPAQGQWFARLQRERENLHGAIEWSLSNGQTDAALRLTGALAVFWRVRGHFSEGRDLAGRAVAASNGAGPAVKGKALWAAGFMTLMTDDFVGAIPVLEESLSVASELGDAKGRGRALLMLGNAKLYAGESDWREVIEASAAEARSAGDSWCLSLALYLAGFTLAARNDFPAARPLLEEALAVARAAHEKQGLRLSLIASGLVALRQGDYDKAEGLLHEAVEVLDDLGERYGEAMAFEYLAELAVGRGDYGRAGQLLDEIHAIAQVAPVTDRFGALVLRGTVEHARGDRVSAAALFAESVREPPRTLLSRALQGMGLLAHEDGDRDEARRLFEEALDLARHAQNDLSAAAALHALGNLAHDARNLRRASTLHHEALDLRRRIGARPGVVASLEAIGGLAAGRRSAHAARLLGAAQTERERRGYARAPWEAARYEAAMQATREELSAADADIAFGQGAGMSIDEAAAQAAKNRAPRRPSSDGWESLTDAERRVATLAAEGLTNRAIAERLRVTPATVKNQLSHIFEKLGVARRVELAAELWQRQGGPGV